MASKRTKLAKRVGRGSPNLTGFRVKVSQVSTDFQGIRSREIAKADYFPLF